MVNLWLDDTRLPGHAPHAYKGMIQETLQWEWAQTVPEAIAIIQRVGIDNIGYMALDHDLGFCPKCQSADYDSVDIIHRDGPMSFSSCKHIGDGTDFVQWMRDNNQWPKRVPTVHSFNRAGARRMAQMIAAHYFPGEKI